MDGADVIQFGEGIAREDIYFTTDNAINNKHLIIKFKNSPSDQITIYSQYHSSATTIETIRFHNGSTLDISNPDNLVFEYHGTENNDTINGSIYNDQITANQGQDIMSGGTGNDEFIYKFFNDSSSTINTADIITDFTQGEDKINLHDLNLLDHFITLDSNPNDETPQGLSYHFDNENNTIVHYNDVANDNNDFSIKLMGQINLGNGDFEF